MNISYIELLILFHPESVNRLLHYVSRSTKYQLMMWKHLNLHSWDCLRSVVLESFSFMCKTMMRMIQNLMKAWTSTKLQHESLFRTPSTSSPYPFYLLTFTCLLNINWSYTFNFCMMTLGFLFLT